MNVFEISELELSAELLPAREALGGGLINASEVVADNTALALNLGGGFAGANAVQTIDTHQK